MLRGSTHAILAVDNNTVVGKSATPHGQAPTRDIKQDSAEIRPTRQGRRGIERREACVSRAAIVSLGQRQKRKRVRPPGSFDETTVAERGAMRYTFHGGGPCDGALNGAVMPDPLSSGSAGQPLSAHAFAIRATAPGSVTRAASPSITTSASRIDTATEHRGSRATLRPLRVAVPVWNQNVPSTQRAPTAVTCGLPSSLTVRHQQRQGRRPRPDAPPERDVPQSCAQLGSQLCSMPSSATRRS